MVVAVVEHDLRALLAPVVDAAGLVLDEVSVRTGGGRTVVVVTVDLRDDDDQTLSLDRIEAVSAQVSAVLDTSDVGPSAYTLEVTSPGADRPLARTGQLRRHLGRRVTVRTTDGPDVAGRLVEVSDDALVVVPSAPVVKGRRPKDLAPIRVMLTDLRAAQVEVDLAGLDATGADEVED
ncbi:MAG: ribosome maturation factor RimP [Cellulomonas sp.]|jgi:ribosome maturation factor RimP|nr:ribosome maturation factor RimP [Cellulomonas sp.]